MAPSVKPFIVRSVLILIAACGIVFCVYVYIQSLYMHKDAPPVEVPAIEEPPTNIP